VWFDECFEIAMQNKLIPTFGEALVLKARDLRDDFRDEVHKLELKVAWLEGRVEALRSSDRKRRGNDAA
jgi:hypothetical protein